MSIIPYTELRYLIVDDFGSLRGAAQTMLANLGAKLVDTASSADEAIEKCKFTSYDVVLCDYNLGDGRTGQHVLEELRFKRYLQLKSVFILVSAESSRDVVMSSYDAAPDDYLMKPLTGQMLKTRLDRLLKLRIAFREVYTCLQSGKIEKAIDTLVDMSINTDKHTTAAKKLLGQLLLDRGDYKKALKLYIEVLEVRELDWARLGLARAKHGEGDLELAGKWLERIIDDNYLYLPAYDFLSENLVERGRKYQAQQVTQMAVQVSPLSILRQKKLSLLASSNGDDATALEAIKRVVKLGKLSCHGSPNDKVDFARTTCDALQQQLSVSPSVVAEAKDYLDAMSTLEGMDAYERQQVRYVSARLCALSDNKEEAAKLLVKAEAVLAVENSRVDVEIDHLKALQAVGLNQASDDLLEKLIETYQDDDMALEKLDPFFDEPISKTNRDRVQHVNKDGISLYNDGQFERALACFNVVSEAFPNHIGIKLNMIQTQIAWLKENQNNESLQRDLQENIHLVEKKIDKSSGHYIRYMQIKKLGNL